MSQKSKKIPTQKDLMATYVNIITELILYAFEKNVHLSNVI